MNRILITTFIFLLSTSFKSFDIFTQGYIQYDGKREQCQIKVAKNYNNKIELKPFMNGVFVKDFKGKIIRYKADQIQGFGFVSEGKTYNFVSFKNTININVPFKGHIFMLCVEEGPITLYQYFYHDVAPGPLVSLSVKGSFYFISKNSSSLIKLDENSDLIDAISDDDELHRSLEKSVILLKDIPVIIKRYNKHKRILNDEKTEFNGQLETFDE